MCVALDRAASRALAEWCDPLGWLQSDLTNGDGIAQHAAAEGVLAVVFDSSRDPGVIRSLRSLPRPRAVLLCLGKLGREPSVASALRAGADDYLVWPSAADELIARLEARLRDRLLHGETADERRPGNPIVLRIDEGRHRVEVNGIGIELRRAELAVVRALVEQRRILSARTLLAIALRSAGDGGAVRNHVYQIRRKLGAADAPDFIDSPPGGGYSLVQGVVVESGQSRAATFPSNVIVTNDHGRMR